LISVFDVCLVCCLFFSPLSFIDGEPSIDPAETGNVFTPSSPSSEETSDSTGVPPSPKVTPVTPGPSAPHVQHEVTIEETDYFEFNVPLNVEEALNYAFPLLASIFLSLEDPRSVSKRTLEKKCGLLSMLGLGGTLSHACVTDRIAESHSLLILDHRRSSTSNGMQSPAQIIDAIVVGANSHCGQVAHLLIDRDVVKGLVCWNRKSEHFLIVSVNESGVQLNATVTKPGVDCTRRLKDLIEGIQIEEWMILEYFPH
jgi:hypothetical protein